MVRNDSGKSPERGEPIACPDCDLLQILPELQPGAKASCTRCGRILAARAYDPIDPPLALLVAALPVLILANTTPLMGLSAVGREASTTILGGAYAMWHQGQELTALVVAFSASIAPAAYVLFLLAVLLAVRRPPAPPWASEILRWAEAIHAWSMVEVMMLGILVALIKIADLATVEPGIGMYALGALMLLFPAIRMSLDLDSIWKRVAWADREQADRMTHTPQTPSDP